jgi:hypothetical protein
VVEQGKNGFLVERNSDTERLIDALSDRMIETWSAIRNGTMTAHAIREHVIPYSVDVQLHQHFARHSQLAARRAA